VAEAGDLVGLAGEGFDDAHAGGGLFEDAGCSGEPVLHQRGRLADLAPEEDHEEGDERDAGEDDDGEAPVEDKEEGGGADEHQGLAQQGDEVAGDRFLQEGDVVGEAADQLAGAPFGVEAQSEPLQVGEDGNADVGDGALADVGEGEVVGDADERLDDEDAEEEDGYLVEAVRLRSMRTTSTRLRTTSGKTSPSITLKMRKAMLRKSQRR
jgi:hypothetical protein